LIDGVENIVIPAIFFSSVWAFKLKFQVSFFLFSCHFLFLRDFLTFNALIIVSLQDFIDQFFLINFGQISIFSFEVYP
jgi:hypothetical protein